MIRIPELWPQRKAKRARVNEQLAAADALVPSQLDRWDRPTVEWTEEQSVQVIEMLAEAGEVGRVVSEKLTIRQLPHGHGFDYRSDPEMRDHNPECDACMKIARWAVAKFEGFDQFGREAWITRHFACYQHLSGVLSTVEWDADEVKVYDLARYDIDWSTVEYEAWVEFNDIRPGGYTTTLRRFTHPEIDASNVGLWILVGDDEGNTAQAEVLSVGDPFVSLRVALATFEPGT